MPLKVFDSQDAVPEELRESAVELKDGKFAVAEDEDVTPLKTTIENTRKEADKAKKAAREAQAKLDAIKAERAAADAGVPPEKLQEIRTQVEQQYKSDIEQRDAKIRELTFGAEMDKLLSKADVVDLKAARKLLDDQFEMSEAGTLVPKADPSVPAEKYIAGELRKEYSFVFKGTQAAGGGASGQPGKGAPTPNAKPVTQWSAEERESYEAQHGEGSVAALRDQYLREAATPKKAAA